LGHLATERPCVLALTLINSQLFLNRSQYDHSEERQTWCAWDKLATELLNKIEASQAHSKKTFLNTLINH